MKQGAPITVAIVDDSALVRRGLRAILESDPRFQVVGEGSNGDDAVRLAVQLEPRIMVLDLDMPATNGLVAVERIMEERPTRILIVTANPSFEGRDSTFEAVSRGALELMLKPTVLPSSDKNRDPQAFRRMVAMLANIPVVPHVKAGLLRRKTTRHARGHDAMTPMPRAVTPAERRPSLIGLGASTGGPSATRSILEALPRDFAVPIVLVQHIASDFAVGYVDWLGSALKVRVVEAKPGAPLVAGTVYVAARGGHIGVSPTRTIRSIDGPPRAGHTPSIDTLFESMAESLGASTVGVLLSGMGQDGALGLRAISDAGGLTMAQEESSCPVFGMPKAALDLGATRSMLTPREIAARLLGLGRAAVRGGAR